MSDTTTNPATPADFAKWRAHARKLDIVSLRYVIDDCRKAEAAMRGWNPVKEGFYADQAATYADEIFRRAAAPARRRKAA